MVSDSVSIAVALIYSLPALVAAILGFLNAKQARDNHQETRAKMDEILVTTNGKMDKLLQVTGEAERAKGVIEGREENG